MKYLSINRLTAMVVLGLLTPLQAEVTHKDDSLGSFIFSYKNKSLEAKPIKDAYVKTTGLDILKLEYIPNDNFFVIPKLSYEITPMDTSTQQDELVEISKEDQNSWEKYLIDLKLNLSKISNNNWQHIINLNYSSETFITTVQSHRDYWFVSDAVTNLITPGENLNIKTEFINQEIGYHWKTTKQSKVEYGVGYFMSSFNRPFDFSAVTGVNTIYDSKLEGKGLYLYLDIQDVFADGLNFKLTVRDAWDVSNKLSGDLSLKDFNSDGSYFSSEFGDYAYKYHEIEPQVNYHFDIMGIHCYASSTYTYRQFRYTELNYKTTNNMLDIEFGVKTTF